MNELDSAFGTLRARMQSNILNDQKSLIPWLIEMEAVEPDHYHTQWVPYLASFPHHWTTSIATAETIETLEQMVRVAPFALFTFDGSAWTGLRRHAIEQGKIPPTGYPPGFLNPYGFNDEKMARLVESPALERVVHLNLVWGNLTHEGVRMLAQCPSLTNLKTLELRYHYGITDVGINALIQSPYITQLEHLDVSQTSATSKSFCALAQSPFSKNLQKLFFWNNVNQTNIAQTFHTSTTLTRLTSLSLSDTSNQDVCDILSSPNASTLQTFEFDAVDSMTPEHIHQISTSPHTNALQTLALSNLELSTPHLEQLASSPNLTALHTLDLSTNHITKEGIQHLASAPWIHHITSLDLSYNPLGHDALDPLITTQFKPTTLTLYQDWEHEHDDIDNALARWLTAPNSANLQNLSLHCAPRAKSILTLAESTHIKRLTTLDLSCATLNTSSLIALIHSPVCQTLERLDLSGLRYDEDEPIDTTKLCQALHDTPYMNKLTHLILNDVSLTDEALIILSQSPVLETVTHLNVAGQTFSHEALRQFASSPYLANLNELLIDPLEEQRMSEQRLILCEAPALSKSLRASFDLNNHFHEIW